MKLIVGLGNPGEKYIFTRHNIGFMALEELARRKKGKFRSHFRFKALTAEMIIGKEKCFIAMPQTFMNLSGHSVRLIANWLKIELGEILLIVDDTSLPFGKIRLRAKGSDAGHKGLRSIIECLGSSEFKRMRIGIMGRSDVKNRSKYVLGNFTKKEKEKLPDILKHVTSACECWVTEGIDLAMNKYNS